MEEIGSESPRDRAAVVCNGDQTDLRYLKMLRRKGRTTGPRFTARTCRGAPRHSSHNVSGKSAVRALRKALRDVCGLFEQQARLYSRHSPRVGGSNHIRRLGVGDEVHRPVGGRTSQESPRGYFQLSPTEQFEITHGGALKERVPPRVEGSCVASLRAFGLVRLSDV